MPKGRGDIEELDNDMRYCDGNDADGVWESRLVAGMLSHNDGAAWFGCLLQWCRKPWFSLREMDDCLFLATRCSWHIAMWRYCSKLQKSSFRQFGVRLPLVTNEALPGLDHCKMFEG